MAFSFPLDVLAQADFVCTRFEILNSQNISQTGGGAQPVVQVGLDLWTGAWETRRPLKPTVFDRLKAYFHALQGSVNPFYGYDTTRCRPIAYPGSETPGDFSGVLSDINANQHVVSISGLPVGYKARAGDFFAYSHGGYRYFHQILEDADANGSGIINTVDIRPHVPVSVTTGQTVDLLKPKMRMKVVPGTLRMERTPSGYGSVGFEGIQILKDS